MSTSTGTTLGSIASSVTSSFTNLTKLITAGSYLAGLGFSVGAIMKFKEHKDNPTQVPIGTPIALDVLAAVLLYLPSILDSTAAASVENAVSSGELSASVKAAADKAAASGEAGTAEAAVKSALA